MSQITVRQITQIVDDQLLSHVNDDGLTHAADLITKDPSIEASDRTRLLAAIQEEQATRSVS